jgi:hypothetical protein
VSGIPRSGAPNILNKAYTITAEVTIPEGGAEGMIVTEGGRFGGYGLFLSPAFNWWSKAAYSGTWVWDSWYSDCCWSGAGGARSGQA